MANKSKYFTHVQPRLKEIAAWCRDGVSDKDIAKNCGVAASTFCDYKNLYAELAEILTRTKDYVDNVTVVGAYYQRAVGYDAVETRREYIIVTDKETGKQQRILVKEIEQTKHIPGDPRAMENWLLHRQPEQWGKIKDNKPNEDNNGGIVLIPAVREDEDDE